MVGEVAAAWISGRAKPPVTLHPTDLPPTPVPDGSWSHARTDLARLAVSNGKRTVPEATDADFAYARGDFATAADGYRTELSADPDRPTSLVGLGLALSARGPHPAARALLHCPELVRAVHRQLRTLAPSPPSVERLAAWIGQVVPG
jgi:hypothetical protein